MSLRMLDIDAMMGVLEGVVMEMNDCALPLLKGETNIDSLGMYFTVQATRGLDMARLCLKC